MTYENIVVETEDRLAVVTVNRPDKMNALNAKTVAELYHAFTELKSDNQVGAVIVTGTGEKAFVAGADIAELAELAPVKGRDTIRKGQALFSLIEGLGKPVIAAINGFALGGGCELALAGTIRVASEKAKLGQPEVNLGLMPGYGGTQRLPRLVGKGKALELILTGKMVDAQEAWRIGLVNQVVPQAELMKSCEEMAKTILSKSPLAIRYCLDVVNQGMESNLEAGLEYEATLFAILCASEDMKEGTAAFLEKRPAKFKGE
jgi:enoyl-CoA hydratase